MYMHLNPDGVRMDRIKGALPSYMTDVQDGAKWQWVDLTMGGGVAEIVGWTSQYAETGAFGEPEKATEEKGRRVFEHATEQLVELVRWFKARPPMPRSDHHATAPTFALPFDF